jgi:hypothetical protein
VVNNNNQITVSPFVGDLIDADPTQTLKTVTPVAPCVTGERTEQGTGLKTDRKRLWSLGVNAWAEPTAELVEIRPIAVLVKGGS